MRSCSETDIDSLIVCGRLIFICADRLDFLVEVVWKSVFCSQTNFN